MGSRAVALVCRDLAAARARFGAPDDASGAVWTRTGRSFFPPELTAELVERLRVAAERAGLFDELVSRWLLLDAELLPWSAKAGELLRDQYAAVGAVATTALPVAIDALGAAEARGWWTALSRRADRLPALADRRVAVDPDLIAPTQRLVVDVDDEGSARARVDWWKALTDAGGEGMVVKPLANLVRARNGILQAGLKVRGPEYLRIIYGPDYTEPATLARLRDRQLGHKRSMALREYALGLEALDRVARGEPLWRVHECVFAVLALESEPVDPRL